MEGDYKAEQKRCKHSNVKIYNFWSSLKKPKNFWFYRFIEHRLKGHYDPQNPISFFSVYGQKEKLQICPTRPKVFFSGENVDIYPTYKDYSLQDVDLALGLDYLDEVEKYLRFPFWIMYFIEPEADFAAVKQSLFKLSNHNYNFSKERKFCTLISRHDNNGIRTKISDLVEQFGPIDYAGRFRNNTSDMVKKYHNSKWYFLTLYKFNVCPENSNRNGYVTEKLFEAIMAGCVPIYWGSEGNPEPNILNHDAIIFYDEQSNSFDKDLAELSSNSKRYQEFVLQNRFLPTAAEYVWDTIADLELKFKELKRNC